MILYLQSFITQNGKGPVIIIWQVGGICMAKNKHRENKNCMLFSKFLKKYFKEILQGEATSEWLQYN